MNDKDKRNLLLMCLLINAYYFLDVEINKIKLLDGDVIIHDPLPILFITVIIWLYMLLKFLNSFFDRNNGFITKNDYIELLYGFLFKTVIDSYNKQSGNIELIEPYVSIEEFKHSNYLQLYSRNFAGNPEPITIIELSRIQRVKIYLYATNAYIFSVKSTTEYVIPIIAVVETQIIISLIVFG